MRVRRCCAAPSPPATWWWTGKFQEISRHGKDGVPACATCAAVSRSMRSPPSEQAQSRTLRFRHLAALGLRKPEGVGHVKLGCHAEDNTRPRREGAFVEFWKIEASSPLSCLSCLFQARRKQLASCRKPARFCCESVKFSSRQHWEPHHHVRCRSAAPSLEDQEPDHP